MKKRDIVCIFAHPDDEAFGPSGTIAKWAKNNNVYLICVTDGSNPNGGIKELKKIRKKELQESAKILGIKDLFFLGYKDGELSNNIYHNVSDEIKLILDQIRPSVLMTFEMRGVSGHIDHMFVSMVTSYLFRQLDYAKEIYYFAEMRENSDIQKDYFIFFPDGYRKDEVDHIEDISEVWDKKINAISCHFSQKEDGDFILEMLSNCPKEEFFLVSKK